jgi:hypothetical protein
MVRMTMERGRALKWRLQKIDSPFSSTALDAVHISRRLIFAHIGLERLNWRLQGNWKRGNRLESEMDVDASSTSEILFRLP